PATCARALEGSKPRLHVVPVPAGNYSDLQLNEKALFWLSKTSGSTKTALKALAISDEEPEVKTVTDDLERYELSADGKKMLIQKKTSLHVIEATAAPATLTKPEADLSGWTLSVVPREQWRQMFAGAWRGRARSTLDRGRY